VGDDWMIQFMPQSNLRGIYVTKTPSGAILTVQVKDVFDHNYPLPPEEYRRRRIEPPIESLPVVIQGGK